MSYMYLTPLIFGVERDLTLPSLVSGTVSFFTVNSSIDRLAEGSVRRDQSVRLSFEGQLVSQIFTSFVCLFYYWTVFLIGGWVVSKSVIPVMFVSSVSSAYGSLSVC